MRARTHVHTRTPCSSRSQAGCNAKLEDAGGRRALQLLTARAGALGPADAAARGPLVAAARLLQQWEEAHKGPSTFKKLSSWFGGGSKQQGGGGGGSSNSSGGGGGELRPAGLPGARTSSGSHDAKARHEHERGELFRGAAGAAAPPLTREQVKEQRAAMAPQQRAAEGVGGAKEAIAMAMQGVNERGEKLNDLALKTSELKDAAADFASMARQLRESQEKKSWFGW